MYQKSIHIGLFVLLTAISQAALAFTIHDKGVHYFMEKEACPVDVMGGAASCHLVALSDDATTVDIDEAQHRIVLHNTAQYAKTTLVADLFLPAKALDAQQKAVLLTLHVKLSRKQSGWSQSFHTHTPVRGKLSQIEMLPWQVVVVENDTNKTILTPIQAEKLLTDPSWALRMAGYFMNIQDNRTPSTQDTPDITASFKFGLTKPFVNARFESQAKQAGQPLREVLRTGDWRIQVKSLSNHLPLDVTQHELFLYGLGASPLLDNVKKNGLKKGQVLILGAKQGQGYLQLDAKKVDFPQAAESAQRFANTSFLGAILFWYKDAHI